MELYVNSLQQHKKKCPMFIYPPVPSCSSANNVAMDGGALGDPTLPGVTVAAVLLRVCGIHSSISLPSKTFNKASFRANKKSLRGVGDGPRPKATGGSGK